jgi:hypothetical protein
MIFTHSRPLVPSIKWLRILFAAAFSLATAIPAFGAQSATLTSLSISVGAIPVTTVPAKTAVTLTAIVQSGGASLSAGQVKFCDASAPYCTDSHLLGLAQITRNGTASIKLVPGSGTRFYKAVFSGTTNYLSSTSVTSSLVVVPGVPDLAASTSLETSSTQGNYTLTATVSTDGGQTPSGNMAFLDTTNANYSLATAAVSGTGSGAVAFRRISQTLVSPIAMAMADFNGDGIPDLVTLGTYGGNQLTVLLGKGDGTFSKSSFAGPIGPVELVTGDFNGDGIPDIAVSSTNSAFTVYLGNGDGTFVQGQTIKIAGARTIAGLIATADFNGDGIADLAITTITGGGGGTRSVAILLGNGDGTFQTPLAGPKTSDAVALIATDINGDGKADLVVANGLADTLTVALGNGDGTFALPTTISTVGNNVALASADLNRDGIPDFVVVDDAGDPPTVLLGKGDGTFTTLPPDTLIGAYPQTILLADVNGDGIPDLIAPDLASSYGTLNVFLGRGDGTFAFDTSSPTLTNYNAVAIAVADFNLDGRNDLAFALQDDGSEPVGVKGDQVDVWVGLPFTTAIARVTGISPVGMGEHDLEAVYSGDGNYAGSTSPLVGVLAQQVPTTLALTVSPTTSAYGQSVTLTANLAPFTAQDHSASGLVTFMSGTTNLGTGAVTNGVASLTTTALPAGYDNLRAVYPGDTNFVTSSSNVISFLVTGGPPQIVTSTTLAVTAGGVAVTSVVSRTLVTLTATVKANGSTLPVGQVIFCDAAAKFCTDVHVLGTAQVTPAGTATLKLVPTVGSHSFKAVFTANTTYSSSVSATAMLQVSSLAIGPTINTLVASGSPGNYTLTATVNGRPNVLPTGSVSFADTTNANYLLGVAPLQVASTGVNVYLASSIATPATPQTIVTADFNGDGIPDAAVSYYQSSLVTIFLGNGDGTFANAGNLPQSITGQALATGDFNADGCADLAFPSYDNTTGNLYLSVLLGRCDGTFAPAVRVANIAPQLGFPGTMAVADLNGDGKLDLVIAVTGYPGNSSYVAALLGNGDGTFSAPIITTAGGEALSMAVADFSSDGHPDVVLANIDGSLSFLYGNGDGSFSVGVTRNFTGSPHGLVTADFNGDGKPDLAVTLYSTNTAAVLLGNGDGTFTDAPSITLGAFPYPITVADFNGDGVPDIAIGNYGDGTASILLGIGDGTFTHITTTPQAGANPAALIAGDYNSDGVPDLLFGNAGTKTLTTLLAASQATATITGVSVVGTGTHYAQSSYPGDSGNLGSISNLVPLVAQTIPTALTLQASPTTSNYGQSITLTATITPDFAQNHNATGTVTFSSNGSNIGTGSISNGVASLTTSTLSAGTDAILASYGGDTNFGPSSSGLNIGVAPVAPTIVFTVPNHTFGDAPFTVAATSNSSGAFSYSVISGPATISGSTVTLTGIGTVVLQVIQSASGNYTVGSQTATFAVNSATPTITFVVPNHTFGDAPFIVSASSNSGGAFTYSVLSGSATILGSTVTLTGAGTVVLQGSQVAFGNYSAGSQTASFMVSVGSPTIIFIVGNHTYGDAPFGVSANSNSAGQFTYSVVSGPATISGSTVTLTGVGTVVLQASQAANGSYSAGSKTASFVVSAGSPTITFSVPNHTYGDPPFTVVATSNSTGVFTYSVISGPATVSGSTVTLTGAGTVVLQVTQAANGNFTSGSQTATFAVSAASPTIIFAVPNHTFGDAPFPVLATSNSLGTITYSVVSGPATIAGSTVTLTGVGTVTLLASQAANGGYGAGSQTATFSVTKESQTITFVGPTSPMNFGSTAVTLTATASSGLPVLFSVVSGPATVSGNLLTLTAAGTVVIAADQGGNSNYSAAVEVTRILVVLGRLAGVNLSANPNPVFLRNPVTLSVALAATGGTPTGSVAFLDGPTLLGTATVSGSSATLIYSALSLGVHSITANYSGDGVFVPAASSAVIVTVQDFSLIASNPNLTINHGGTATYNLTLNSIGGVGMASTVNLSISGAPEHSEITFTPQSIPSGSGTTAISLVIHTPNYPTGPFASTPTGMASRVSLGFLALGVLLLPFRKRRMLRGPLKLLNVVVLLGGSAFGAIALTGCGSGWRTQNFTMQVTANSGQLTRTTVLTLTSQCSGGQPACPVENQ